VRVARQQILDRAENRLALLSWRFWPDLGVHARAA
jgi:hypothetical protein